MALNYPLYVRLRDALHGAELMLPFIHASEAVALRRYYNGDVPCFSTGIDDFITAGYGRLSPHGFWEFPLPWFFIVQHGWHDYGRITH